MRFCFGDDENESSILSGLDYRSNFVVEASGSRESDRLSMMSDHRIGCFERWKKVDLRIVSFGPPDLGHRGSTCYCLFGDRRADGRFG